jgi:hypothetical protein
MTAKKPERSLLIGLQNGYLHSLAFASKELDAVVGISQLCWLFSTQTQ